MRVMPTVVDSRQNQLPAPEIIIRFTQEMNDTEYPVQNVLAAIAKELTMPNTDQVQIGNTVFIGNRGKGKHKNAMVGRALNIDTGQNFVRSGLKYLSYLQNKGIRYYRTEFNAPEYVSAFKFWYNKLSGTDTEVDVVQLDNGSYRAYIYIGDDSLKAFWRL
jgi:hypothetical protein